MSFTNALSDDFEEWENYDDSETAKHSSRRRYRRIAPGRSAKKDSPLEDGDLSRYNAKPPHRLSQDTDMEDEWTPEQIATLLRAFRRHEQQKWKEIAKIADQESSFISPEACKKKVFEAQRPLNIQIVSWDFSGRTAEGDHTLGDHEAILNAPAYFKKLDDLEESVFNHCTDALGLLTANQAQQPVLSYTQSMDILEKALQLMQDVGVCCNEFQSMLHIGTGSSQVLRAFDLSIRDIEKVKRVIRSSYVEQGITSVQFRLSQLGVLAVSRDEVLAIFVRICAYATMAFAGSMTAESVGEVLSSQASETGSEITEHGIPILGAYNSAGKPLHFYRQHLSCLGPYVGAPVWTFGAGPSEQPAAMSITVPQLAQIWGPLFAVPSGTEKHMCSAIQTEDGILYRSAIGYRHPDAALGETAMHWSRASPIMETADPDTNEPVYCLSVADHDVQDSQPAFLDFSPNSRLLIGALGREGQDTPVETSKLAVNIDCAFDWRAFVERNWRDFHPCGTSDAYYAPEALQVSFTGGQYIGMGGGKTWKRREGATYKSRILYWLSNPKENPDDVRRLLDLRIGLEMSACTMNARRISLLDALLLAFPLEKTAIEEAYRGGTAVHVLRLICELSFTGITPDGKFQLYWPKGSGREVFEILDDRPKWRDIVLDSRDSACFAVLSTQCLCYSGFDALKNRAVKMTCSLRSSSPLESAMPAFETQFVVSASRPQTEQTQDQNSQHRAALQIASGTLWIRNSLAAPLVSYERHSVLNTVRRARTS